MKARKVKGLDPDEPLAPNALRIVKVRLDELHSLAEAAQDPAEVEALHDMRIAAKRLRYVLEVTAPVFGEPAERGAKAARKLQDVLGEIHDCDVFVPRVEEHMAKLRTEDAAALRRAAGQSSDLDPAFAREAPNRRLYRGLETLDAYLRARREVLFASFVRQWRRIGAEQLGPALLDAMDPGTLASDDG